MSAATLLTRLYPPAVQERWGADISHEVSTAGIRSWPDTLVGAVRLWLHPSDWGETRAGQTRRVLTVTLFAVVAATVLTLRTAAPSTAWTADPSRPATSLWLVPLLIGIALGSPLPRFRPASLRYLAAVAVRTLAAPAVAVAALLALAWSGVAGHVTGPAAGVLVGYYWGTLAFVALRCCTLVARISGATALPSTRRLSVALLFFGLGLTLAAGQSLLVEARSGVHPSTIAVAVVLAVLAAGTLTAGHDLRRHRASR
ncbi:hypothetical protein Athai_66120 [Actinocatenispora thailandica]|uniref:Uncharacterized protein n=1 Tax=Actinocatenispora thailandica TaxID=227318 RepID=A0A7R7I115_9ACTN|nr:hypothetical protein [Actinocatenispora thailandica]BCJ39109.1 hypothetical protein Athai_66120 [Actinocatenispora thailandica]